MSRLGAASSSGGDGRKVRRRGDVDRPLKAERRPLLHAGSDTVLALELEGTVVVDQSIKPAIERASGGRQHEHLMGPCPECLLDQGGLGAGAHDHGGHESESART